jgi:hypothetical protein
MNNNIRVEPEGIVVSATGWVPTVCGE